MLPTPPCARPTQEEEHVKVEGLNTSGQKVGREKKRKGTVDPATHAQSSPCRAQRATPRSPSRGTGVPFQHCPEHRAPNRHGLALAAGVGPPALPGAGGLARSSNGFWAFGWISWPGVAAPPYLPYLQYCTYYIDMGRRRLRQSLVQGSGWSGGGGGGGGEKGGFTDAEKRLVLSNPGQGSKPS